MRNQLRIQLSHTLWKVGDARTLLAICLGCRRNAKLTWASRFVQAAQEGPEEMYVNLLGKRK